MIALGVIAGAGLGFGAGFAFCFWLFGPFFRRHQRG